MKEIPMSFTGESVRAIQARLKMMTRRTRGLQEINKQPNSHRFLGIDCVGKYCFELDLGDGATTIKEIKCPYHVGDRIWVKETHVIENDREYGYSESELELWEKDRPIKTVDGGFDFGIYHLIPHYRATEPEPNIVSSEQDTYDDRTRWESSRFMPRWASRINLEITEVRNPERLQEVTIEDVEAEGIKYNPIRDFAPENIILGFAQLWDSIYDKGTPFNDHPYRWQLNPWVWPIRFKEV